MSKPKFTVAICGGGICGLTTAIAIANLSRNKDIRIDVYEASQAFTEVGAGVTVWRRPWQILNSLGLTEDLLKVAPTTGPSNEPALAFRMRKSDQPTGIHYYDMVIPTGGLSFHRADFLNCLINHVDKDVTKTHFSKRLLSYTKSSDVTEQIILSFTDGTSANCDILIGADGIHSATRRNLLDNVVQAWERNVNGAVMDDSKLLLRKKEPTWSGLVSYRALIPSERLRNVNPNHGAFSSINAVSNSSYSSVYSRQPFMISIKYTGRDKHLICYPIAKGRFINFVALCYFPDGVGTVYEGKLVEERDKEEVRREFAGWEEEVTQLLQCLDQNPLRWVVNTVDSLPIVKHGTVVIAGDAAHAMEPHQGSGAGQAMEDAYILGAILTHPLVTRSTLSVALDIYQELRLPRALDVQKRSVVNGRLYNFRDDRFAHFLSADGHSTILCTGDDVGRLWEIGHAAVDNWMWAWTTNIEDDRRRAIELIEHRLGS